MSADVEEHYAPVEIAALLKVSKKTVQGWLRDPDHPLVGTKIGTMWRVSKGDLKKYLEGK